MPTLSPLESRLGDVPLNGAVGGVLVMPVKNRLERVENTFLQDMIIGGQGQLPMFEGQEPESLVCPGCDQDVTSGVSAQTLEALFQPPARLLFHCDCGTYAAIDGEPSHATS